MSRLTEVILKGFGFFVAEFYRLSPLLVKRSLVLAVSFSFSFFRFKAKIIDQNLRIAYGNDREAKDKIKKDFYKHFSQLIFEILQHLGNFKAYAKQFCNLEGLEHYQEAIKQGRGVILVSSHVGNWELMSASGGLADMDLMIVTKKLKPAWLHDSIEKSRLSTGVKGAYEPQTLKSVLKHLRSKQTVGIVLDQYAGPPIGVRVPFFGTHVGTSSLVALLARRTSAPILPVVTHRSLDGVLHTKIGKPFSWIQSDDSHEELALNTSQYVKRIETDVKAHPSQWLWTHRRFKGDLSPLRPNEWREPRSRF